MAQEKSGGSRFFDFLLTVIIELPVAIWLGTQKPLWQEPPLVIALWIGGFALVFFVILKIVSRRPALDDFIATGRKMAIKKYPKPRNPR